METRPVAFDAVDLAAVPEHHDFPSEAACPLLLADLLPTDLPRVLFLDADLLVLDDVADLSSLGLEPRVLAAVPDTAIPWCRAPRGVKDHLALGIPDDDREDRVSAGKTASTEAAAIDQRIEMLGFTDWYERNFMDTNAKPEDKCRAALIAVRAARAIQCLKVWTS